MRQFICNTSHASLARQKSIKNLHIVKQSWGRDRGGGVGNMRAQMGRCCGGVRGIFPILMETHIRMDIYEVEVK